MGKSTKKKKLQVECTPAQALAMLDAFLASLCPYTRTFQDFLPREGKNNRTSSRRKDNGDTYFIAYRFLALPDKEQAHTLSCFAGSCRYLWNQYVERYKENKEILKPAAIKKEPGKEWLSECDSLALANVQLNFEAAVYDYNAGDKGKPKFKKKTEHRDSYKTNFVNDNIVYDNEKDTLKLPKIDKPVKVKGHRKVVEGGTLKSVTVTHEPDGRWYASILFEYPACGEFELSGGLEEFFRTKDPSCLKHIGLDMSLPHLFISSDGTLPQYGLDGGTVKFVKQYKKLEKKIGREQRALSKMKEGSKNYEKQCLKVAKLHARAKHARKDFLAQLAVRLAGTYDVISIEDLNMSAMKQALKFGKSVSDNGWGMFTDMLEKKCLEYGHTVIRVDKFFPSSRTCCKCGYIHKELKLSDRTYICPKCGHVMDRDVQAAINIDREGLRMLLDPEPLKGTKKKTTAAKAA